MKLHWMHVHGQSSPRAIKEISVMADLCSYYSVLFVYHSLISDNWMKCANAIDEQHKFKYHIAVRSYSISPEYFVMMYRSFNEIQKNRIMFNIVAGDIHDNETSVDDILLDKGSFDTVEKRVEYTSLWIKKVLSLLNDDEIPEIVMSGISDKTLSSAAIFADYTLCMVDTYLDNSKAFSKNKNKMVCAALVIRQSYKEAEEFVNQIEQKHQKRWTIFGTEKQVIKRIKYLESIGVTDLLIRSHKDDAQVNLIHDLVKENNGVI